MSKNITVDKTKEQTKVELTFLGRVVFVYDVGSEEPIPFDIRELRAIF